VVKLIYVGELVKEFYKKMDSRLRYSELTSKKV